MKPLLSLILSLVGGVILSRIFWGSSDREKDDMEPLSSSSSSEIEESSASSESSEGLNRVAQYIENDVDLMIDKLMRIHRVANAMPDSMYKTIILFIIETKEKYGE